MRYSAAKGIARISERLPTEFADQVLETIMSLFSIHSLAAASLYDLPAIAESTWHGACLACAEMARRGVVAQHKLPELIDWLLKVRRQMIILAIIILMLGRHFILIYGRELIRLDRTSVTLQHMPCGHLLEHRILQCWLRMLTILLDTW